jgi:hypothetical protein
VYVNGSHDTGTLTIDNNDFSRDYAFTTGGNRRLNSVRVYSAGTDIPSNNPVVNAKFRQVSSNIVTLYLESTGGINWSGRSISVSLTSPTIHNGTRTVTATGTATINRVTYPLIRFSQTTSNVFNPVSVTGTVTPRSFNTLIQNSGRNFDVLVRRNNAVLQTLSCDIAALGLNTTGGLTQADDFLNNLFTTARDFGEAETSFRAIGNGSEGGTWSFDERIRVKLRINYTDRY